MKIWFYPEVRIAELQSMGAGTLIETLGIEFLEIGDDFLRARMPVNGRTIQPYRVLHGGASVALAETLGSYASNLCVDFNEKRCVGMEINANHVRSVPFGGQVFGTARPIHIGQKTHLWDVRIFDELDHLVCASRLTMAVLDVKSATGRPEPQTA